MSRYTYKLEASSVYIKNEELDKKIDIYLNKKSNPNILLYGDAGSGKTEFVAQLNYPIVAADLASLVSGTHYRGVLEEKFKELINYCIENNKILFIDEIHNLSNLRGVEGGLNILDMLKPFLTLSNLKVIGATTYEEKKQLVEDKAFMRRFIQVEVKKLDESKINEIMEKEWEKNIKLYKINIPKKFLKDYLNLWSGVKEKRNMISVSKEDIDTIFCYYYLNIDSNFNISNVLEYIICGSEND